MTSVIWHATISLDGFLAGTDGDMSWFRAATQPLAAVWNPAGRVGAIVAGRRTHDLGMVGDSAGPYGGAWRGPIMVPTSRSAERSPHPDVVFVDGVTEAVRRARAAAGERDVAVFGGAVGSVALGLGLVDELLVHIVPVLLGDGIRLYPRTECQAFEVLEASAPGELTSLRLRPLVPATRPA
jgi:dihydrofolate reductase